MKKSKFLSTVVAAAFILTNTVAVNAAVSQKVSNGSFTGYDGSEFPFGGVDYSLRNKQSDNEGTTASAVNGLYGKAADDTSVKIKTEQFTRGEKYQNPYLFAPEVKGLNEGDQVVVTAKLAMDDLVSERYIEITPFFNATHYTWSNTKALGIAMDGSVTVRGAKVAQTVNVVTGKWYNIKIVITVGRTKTDSDLGAPNVMSAYIDGICYGTVDFDGFPKGAQDQYDKTAYGTDDMVAITGIRAGARFESYNISGSNGTVMKEETTYWDDIACTVYNGGDVQSNVYPVTLSGSWTDTNVSVTNNAISALTTISAEDLLAGIQGTNVKSFEYLDASYKVQSAGKVNNGYIRFYDNNDDVYYCPVITQKMIYSDDFNRVGGTGALPNTGMNVQKTGTINMIKKNSTSTTNTDGTYDLDTFKTDVVSTTSVDATGIAGKKTGNGVYVVRSNFTDTSYVRVTSADYDAEGKPTKIKSSDTIIDPFLDYTRSTGLNAPLVIEGSAWTDSPNVTLTLTPFYKQSGSVKSINALQLSNSGYTYGVGIATGEKWNVGEWYKFAAEFVPQTNGQTKVNAYLNGELIKSTNLTVDNNGLYRFKIYGGYYGSEARNVTVAFDDIKMYSGYYDGAEDLVSVQSQSSLVTVDNDKNNILIDRYDTAEKINASAFDSYISSNAKSFKVYEDATMQAEADMSYGLATGNVIAFTSANAETIAYYNVMVGEDFAGIYKSTYSFTDGSITVPFKTPISKLKENVTLFFGNTMTVKNGSGNVLSDSDLLTPGDVISVTNGSDVIEYTVSCDYLVNETFDNWDDTVYTKSNKLTGSLQQNIVTTESNESATISAVAEEGRGKVLKMWSNSVTDTANTTNKNMYIFYAPSIGSMQGAFAVEADIKAEKTPNRFVITMSYQKEGSASTVWSEMINIMPDDTINYNSGKVTETFDTTKWHNIKLVCDPSQSKAILYLDGQKIVDRIDFVDLTQLLTIRFQNVLEKDQEAVQYFDNIKIYELSSLESYDFDKINTEITSADDLVTASQNCSVPNLRVPANMTIAQLKSALSSDATLTYFTNGVAATDSDIVTADTTVEALSVDGQSTAIYSVEPYFFSDIFFTKDDSNVTANIKVSANTDSPRALALAIASYDGDEMMAVNFVTESATESKTVSVSIPNSGTVKAFAFESMMTLKPIAKSVIFAN